MPFLRSVAGLRVTLVGWTVLLVADGALWVAEHDDWPGHLAMTALPAYGLASTALRLRRSGAKRIEPQHSTEAVEPRTR